MLEICAANLPSALAAQAAGADRIELCCALDSGGLTPSFGLLRAVRRALSIPIYVLIRPREGHFVFSQAEVELMLDDIRHCRDAGADGVVFGALTPDGLPDLAALRAMAATAKGMDTTFHRAFDFSADPFQTLDLLADLGIGRVLSSGQAATAFEGRFLLRKMVDHAAGRIRIMPGAGISAANIAEIARSTGAREFHLSARKKIPAPAEIRQIPGLNAAIWVSAEQSIRETQAALRQVI